MESDRRKSNGPLIGLDIGSFAVRAAEVSTDGPRPALNRFGQVTLPAGAVVDGEVIDVDAVADAVKRLWSEVGFSSRRVVVGVSSQRVIVRQAEVLEMSERELRSSLQFEAADLIPIPVDEAVLDFTILPSGDLSSLSPEAPKMRILLAAAQRTMVSRHLAVLKKSGLEAVAVDPLALALLRGIPSEHNDRGLQHSGEAEAVVSVGGDLTTIAVQQGGVVRFVRVLGIGGSNLTDAVSKEMGIDADTAEGVKRGEGQSPVAVGPIESTKPVAVTRHVAVLVDQIRGSIEFYRAQKDAKVVGRIVVTGGGSKVEGAVEELQAAFGRIVQPADPLAGMNTDSTGLTAEQLRQAAPYLLAPIGLALWEAAAGRQITLLPDEVLIRRRTRRQAEYAALALALFAAVLGLVFSSGASKVDHAKSHARTATVQVAQLQRQVAALASVTTTRADVAARTQLYQSALKSNIDWVGLLAEISVVMPPSSYLTSFGATTTPIASDRTPPSSGVGQINMAVISKGGYASVADWLRALAVLPGLQNVIVASEATGAGVAPGTSAATISFSSTATVTAAAESNRSAQVPG